MSRLPGEGSAGGLTSVITVDGEEMEIGKARTLCKRNEY